jgi:hypothetical protein
MEIIARQGSFLEECSEEFCTPKSTNLPTHHPAKIPSKKFKINQQEESINYS